MRALWGGRGSTLGSAMLATFMLTGCGDVGTIQTPTDEGTAPNPSVPARPGDDPEPVTPGAPGTPNPPNPDPTTPVPDPDPQPVCASVPPLTVGANKVKTLLTGHALSSSELQRLNDGLQPLVEEWWDSPAGQVKLRDFFSTALQQAAFDDDAQDELFTDSVRFGDDWEDLLAANFSESLARTALQFSDEGVPFNRIVDTQRFMMTTSMMVALAFLDVRFRTDDNRLRYRGAAPIDEVTYHRNRDIPREDSFNPDHPDFMNFALPELDEDCPVDSISSRRGPALRARAARPRRHVRASRRARL